MAKMTQTLDPSNPICAAVLPLKVPAQDRAEQAARKVIEKVTAELAAAGGDLQVCAPYPCSMTESRATYHQKLARYSLFRSLTERTGNSCRRMRDPEPAAMSAPKAEQFVTTARDMAAQQYDLFIFKLTGKIGAVASATLEGNHIWAESFLTVVKANGTREVWKTQTILNHSKFGLPFFQWPSRKLKSVK